MVNSEPSPSIRTETAHYYYAVRSMPELLRAQEQRLTPLGKKTMGLLLYFKNIIYPTRKLL